MCFWLDLEINVWPPYSVIVPYYIVCIVKYFKSSAKLFNLKSINSKYSKRGLKKREEKQRYLYFYSNKYQKCPAFRYPKSFWTSSTDEINRNKTFIGHFKTLSAHWLMEQLAMKNWIRFPIRWPLYHIIWFIWFFSVTLVSILSLLLIRSLKKRNFIWIGLPRLW